MAQDVEIGLERAVSFFSDRLADAVERKRSQLLVGLDPRPDLLPVELRGEAHRSRAAAADACARFCQGLVDAVAPYVVGVKLQLAFFEALGSDGLRAFEESCAYARTAGLLVVADGKRGDIGSTARAYADAYIEQLDGVEPLVDALTINPYLGSDSVEPFVAACRRSGTGLFCLVKTTNAGSADIQDVALADGRPLWQHVAQLVNEWGAGLVGERGLSEHRCRRRGDVSPRGRRSAQLHAPGGAAPARDWGAGRDPGRRGEGLHERARERARLRVPLGDLRVPRRRRRLAQGSGRGGGAAARRGLGGLRVVDEPQRRVWAARLVAPLAFFGAATVFILLLQAGLNGGSTDTATSANPSATAPSTTTTVGTTTASGKKKFYRVKSGDTLESIAAKFDTTVDDLLTLNPNVDPLALSPRQRIRVS